VSAVGAVNGLPMTGGAANGTFLIDNDTTRTGDADYRVASAGYFAAMGIPLVRGRVFADSDGPDVPHAAVISESVARRYFAGVDPIGQRIQFGNMDGDIHLLNVVGIVGDVRERGLDKAARPTIYASLAQRPLRTGLAVVVRSAGDLGAQGDAERAEVRRLDPELPVEMRTLEQIFTDSLAGRRLGLVLLAAFAAAALLLAVTGVYGVIATSVAQRRHEIGIRVALGARPATVVRMVLGQGAVLAGLGVALGAAAALALTRLIASLLYGIDATDPTTFAVVGPTLVALALLACLVPAWRALRVDPMVALRDE
jgi:predicted permease